MLFCNTVDYELHNTAISIVAIVVVIDLRYDIINYNYLWLKKPNYYLHRLVDSNNYDYWYIV